MKTPKEYIGEYWGSVFGKAEAEWVWNNIIKILSRTGNTWRDLSWDEYVAERKKDAATDRGGGFNSIEKGYFDDVVSYTTSEERAKAFTRP